MTALLQPTPSIPQARVRQHKLKLPKTPGASLSLDMMAGSSIFDTDMVDSQGSMLADPVLGGQVDTATVHLQCCHPVLTEHVL